MGLNKQAGNMYPDISHTWNPLIGECPHKCSYCSTNKLRERYPEMENRYSGELRLSEKHFEDIFVCAQNDLFARAVPEKFITRIFDHCKKYPNNKYYFQSKNPIRMVKYVFDFPPETVILTTIETNREIYIGHYSGGLRAKNRAIAMAFFHNAIITIEPIMQFDLNQFVKLINHNVIHCAWDDPDYDMIPKIKEIVKYIKPYKLMCYVLIGFDSTVDQDLMRVEKLEEYDISPFVMPYNKSNTYQKRFARWVNNKAIFKSVKWEDYKG